MTDQRKLRPNACLVSDENCLHADPGPMRSLTFYRCVNCGCPACASCSLMISERGVRAGHWCGVCLQDDCASIASSVRLHLAVLYLQKRARLNRSPSTYPEALEALAVGRLGFHPSQLRLLESEHVHARR